MKSRVLGLSLSVDFIQISIAKAVVDKINPETLGNINFEKS
jgi:hypothetical protein